MKLRLINGFKLFYWGFKHPQTLQNSNFQMLSELLSLILKVATEKRPMMGSIALIHTKENNENEIVSLWAGVGASASPNARILELLAENKELKRLLADKINP